MQRKYTTTAPITNRDDIQALMGVPGRDGLFIAIGLFTAYRLNEIVNMKWSTLLNNDLSVKDKLIIYVSKQDKKRSMQVHPFLKKKIEAYRDKLGDRLKLDAYIFTNTKGPNRGTPLTERGVNVWIIKKWLDKLGIVTRNPSSHTLRKTMARKFFEASNEKYDNAMALVTTMKMLGHRDPSTTLRYIGVQEEEIDSIVSNLNY